ncbi:hypothetical protein MTO96_003143 [Rhipicephalus appendiculatus]
MPHQLCAFLCPVQAVIFRVMEHPLMPGFYQCVTFAFFAVPWHEKAYNIFCLLALYGVPLVAIVVCYCRILWEIHKQSKESHVDQLMQAEQQPGRLRLRRSDVRHITRARNRTLRLTIIIVLAFFLCWTPYVIMVLWYQIDPESASNVDGYVQSSLFMFAVSNSCVNPLVYGSFTSSFRKGLLPGLLLLDAEHAPRSVHADQEALEANGEFVGAHHTHPEGGVHQGLLLHVFV